MKWIGITGSWRKTNEKLEAELRDDIEALIKEGNGIVSGGALGVDYIATDEALKHDPKAERIKIILPTSLEIFEKHFFTRADEGVIKKEQAHMLISQLKKIKELNPNNLTEMFYDVCNPKTYYARNSQVIAQSDELYAYHVNGSKGTQDTIDKARSAGMAVKLREYIIS